jgi:hypothetical protein
MMGQFQAVCPWFLRVEILKRLGNLEMQPLTPYCIGGAIKDPANQRMRELEPVLFLHQEAVLQPFFQQEQQPVLA